MQRTGFDGYCVDHCIVAVPWTLTQVAGFSLVTVPIRLCIFAPSKLGGYQT